MELYKILALIWSGQQMNQENKTPTGQTKKDATRIWTIFNGGLVITLLAMLIPFLFKLSKLPDKVDSIEVSFKGNIDELKEDVHEIQGEIKDMKEESADDLRNVLQRISKLEAYHVPASTSIPENPSAFSEPSDGVYIVELCHYNATPYMMNGIQQDFAEVENSLNPSPTYCDSPVAVDPETNIEYTASELSDEKIILSYQDDQGQDVYFCGQFSEDGRWTGSCILNIYKNGNLVMITDALYDNGRIVSSKQCYQGYMLTAPYSAIWSFSFRVMNDGNQEGETWRYFRDEVFPIAFTPENLTYKDFITADGFFNAVSSQAMLVEYYSGTTSNGVYNDNTGSAFRLINFSDGSVRTFYTGQFKDRDFHDSTGNAWMIGKNELEQSAYAYYKGRFENGKPIDNDAAHWRTNLTLDDIEQILKESGISCPCPLNWGE